MTTLLQLAFFATTMLAIAVLLRRIRRLEAGTTSESTTDNATRQAPVPAPSRVLDPIPGAMEDMLMSPLTVILGQCELARGKKQVDARLEIIERQARRIADLLKRQSVTAVPATAPVEAEVRVLDPGACARAAVDTHAGLALERGVRVHFLADETPPVKAKPALLSHALRHLVLGAVQAAPKGIGDVTVAVGEIDGEILFAVADDGEGISAERLAMIFDPVANHETEPLPEELGYSIVYAVSRALNATFLLDTAPGAGTRATLKLPVYKPAAQDAGPVEVPTLVTA